MAQNQQTPPAQSGNKLNTAFVQSKMQIPPNLQQAYQRIILAGKKIMFSPQMTPQIATLLKGADTPGQKIGQGVVALMAMLISQSNHTLPPQLIIPCACELLIEFGNFLRSSGVQVGDSDIADGMAVMISTIMQRVGIAPDQLQGMLQSKGRTAPPAAPAPGAPQPAGA